MAEQWYWCLTHQQVEPAGQCRAEVRMGPYPTRAEAESWQASRDAREDAWESEEDRWKGPRDDWGRRSG